MFVLAFSVNETDSGPAAPDITFHVSVNEAEQELRRLTNMGVLESNKDTRVEFEAKGNSSQYRFFDTGNLRGEDEELWYSATICPVP